MKYDNGLRLDNQADCSTVVHMHTHMHAHMYTEWHQVKEEDREKEKGMLGIGWPTKCHFVSEWTEKLNTIDVTHQTDISCLIWGSCTQGPVCKLDKLQNGPGNETETDILDQTWAYCTKEHAF